MHIMVCSITILCAFDTLQCDRVVLTDCRKEAKTCFPLPPSSPYCLEGETVANRLAASQTALNYRELHDTTLKHTKLHEFTTPHYSTLDTLHHTRRCWFWAAPEQGAEAAAAAD